MLLLIVDIDGTLADIEKRNKIAGPVPDRHDREAFQAWLDRLQTKESLSSDAPIPGMQRLLSTLSAAHIVYLTGRSYKYEEVTMDWLHTHGFPLAPLLMRANNDWRRAADFKEGAMKRYLRYYTAPVEVVVLDDDGDGCCAEMYRKNGWTHLKAMWNWGVIQ